MAILGIETSCDETAAGIVALRSGRGEVCANIIHSQVESHKAFGGVVPELAARDHLRYLDEIIRRALVRAKVGFGDITALAATTGPGLIGGLITGAMMARVMARVLGKPFFAINHLEGHALSGRLEKEIAFPYLAFLLSGGHSQIILVRGVGEYERWSTTIDDALGEAFDKVAKLLGLEYPGGPAVEKAARGGSIGGGYNFPKPLANKFDMSFSGLKTSVRKAWQDSQKTQQVKKDICASFQSTVVEILLARTKMAIEKFENEFNKKSCFVICGGVGNNKFIKNELSRLLEKNDWRFVSPSPELCSDNGAMIAWAALERMRANIQPSDFVVRARWPLDEKAQAKIGGGKKGAKV